MHCVKSSIWLSALFCVVSATPIRADFLDWLWSSKKHDERQSNKIQMTSIPFETEAEDEKFLEEALKFTDLIKSSSLDVCQHNVVLKIKTSCSSMTEEELAKMSVNLLNCQSSVDGRKIFPCRDDMTLKACTESMDPSMWNAYHMMNNRARAVCLAARRQQFHALTEMMVNKLMRTSQDQINHLLSLHDGQEKLEQLQFDTMATIRQGNVDIMLQQDQLRNSHLNLQNVISYNLKELSREKALIAAGQRELAHMTERIKDKLEQTRLEISSQSTESANNHQQLLSDLKTIQNEADKFFKGIDESTHRLLKHNELAVLQFESTLKNLGKINQTVAYLLSMAEKTNKQINWIISYLGDSGAQVESTFIIIMHLSYLFMGMLLAVFLKLPFISRVGLILFVPLNLLLALEKEDKRDMNFVELTTLLFFITIVNGIIQGIRGYTVPRRQKYFLGNGTSNVGQNTSNEESRSNFTNWFQTIYLKLMEKLNLIWCQILPYIKKVTVTQRNEDTTDHSFQREPHNQNSALRQRTRYSREPENPDNFVSRWLETTTPYRQREFSPSISMRSGSSKCAATCRNNRRCRNSSVQGSNFCHIHDTGSPIRG